MTQQEIAAKEIGENLHGALHQLRQARRLINKSDHAIASGNTELAIRETEQAIKMMKQDYANYARCVDGCCRQCRLKGQPRTNGRYYRQTCNEQRQGVGNGNGS